MARGARGIFAVLLHLLPQRAGELLLVREFRHVGRRRWRRRAEEVFQNPFAALHRRGARGVRRERENAALREQTAARRALQRDAHELVARDARDAVVLGEPLVEVGEIRVDEGRDAAILADDGVHEHRGFLDHRIAQRIGVTREQRRVGREQFEVAQLQPLAREILDERGGLRIVQEPLDLRGKLFAQLPLLSEREEFLVRHRTPEEIRKARREREFVHRMNRRGVVRLGLNFAAKQKMRRDEHGLQRQLNRLLEAVGVAIGEVEEPQQAVEFLGLHGAAIRAAREVGDDLARDGGPRLRGGLADHDAAIGLGTLGRRGLRRGVVERADEFEIFDDEIAVAVLGIRILGVEIIVDERGGEFLVARRELHLEIINLRRALDGLHVEHFHRLAIETKFHPRGIGAGLLAERFRAQNEFTSLGDFDRRAEFALSVQRLAVVAEGAAVRGRRKFRGGEMFRRRGISRAGREGGLENFLGGGGVFLEQHGRQRQRVADVVEAVAGIVGGKIIGGLELHADEIADGVVVLGAVQAANRDAARIGLRAIHRENLAVNPRREEVALGLRGLRFVRRRHLAIADVGEHFFPRLRILHDGGGVLVGLHVELGLLLRVAVAIVAVAGEQGLDSRFVKRRGLGVFGLGGGGVCRGATALFARDARGNRDEENQCGNTGGDRCGAVAFDPRSCGCANRACPGNRRRRRGEWRRQRGRDCGRGQQGNIDGNDEGAVAIRARDCDTGRFGVGLESLTAVLATKLHNENVSARSDARHARLDAPNVNALRG